MEVLNANNSGAGGDRTLRTCAIRLAGVYGPGEHRHLPRIVVSSVASQRLGLTRTQFVF